MGIAEQRRSNQNVLRQRAQCGEEAGTKMHEELRGNGRSKTGRASFPHVKLALMGALGPSGERQEHVDAGVAFVGARQRRRMFRVLCIITVKQASGNLSEECRFRNLCFS